MNVHLVASPILVLLLSHYAPSQPVSRGVDQTGPPTRDTANTADALKQNLIRQIALAEAAVRQAEAAHESNAVLSRTYVQLGLWYQSAAQFGRSEAALDHAVSLLRQPFESRAEIAYWTRSGLSAT
jgi:hypothetical protein